MKRATLQESMKKRIVTYHIDDAAYFKKLFAAQGATPQEIENIVDCMNAWQAKYTLIGTPGQYPDRYELYDAYGNKLSITELNGYQKGIVINACIKHYMGELAQEDVTGVYAITERFTEEVA